MLLATISFGQNDLIITAVYDGPLSGGTPKGVELYVVNDIPNLSVYGIGSANNGDGTDGMEYQLADVTASAGDYIYIATEATEFANFFGFAPDYTTGHMGVNGDDAVELFYDATGAFGGVLEVVVDLYGYIDVDGSGQTWEYMDGWSYRNDGEGPNSVFTEAEWNIAGANVLDGETTNGTATTPIPVGTYTTGGTPTEPQISNVTHTPASPASTDAVNVYATVTDDGTITEVNLKWGIVSGNYTQTIAMPIAAGDVYSTTTTIDAQVAGTTVYYVVWAQDGTYSTTSTEQSYTVVDMPTQTLFISEYIEGSGNNKAIEIYNPTDAAVDLQD